MSKEQAQNEILTGWKDFERELGISRHTLYDWHRYHLKIPFYKTSENKGGVTLIMKEDLQAWYEAVKKMKPHLGLKVIKIS